MLRPSGVLLKVTVTPLSENSATLVVRQDPDRAWEPAGPLSTRWLMTFPFTGSPAGGKLVNSSVSVVPSLPTVLVPSITTLPSFLLVRRTPLSSTIVTAMVLKYFEPATGWSLPSALTSTGGTHVEHV